jgi:hypothetical protein
MWCDGDKCPRPNEPITGGVTNIHCFSGWGFFVKFHPECCPRDVAGDKCMLRHPDA